MKKKRREVHNLILIGFIKDEFMRKYLLRMFLLIKNKVDEILGFIMKY